MYHVYFSSKQTLHRSRVSIQLLKVEAVQPYVGVELRLSALEGQSYLGIGRRGQEPFCRIIWKMKVAYLYIQSKYVLQVANKAMKDIVDESGLVPSQLFFGILSRLLIIDNELPKLKERLEAMKVARAEMNQMVTERRVQTALYEKFHLQPIKHTNWASRYWFFRRKERVDWTFYCGGIYWKNDKSSIQNGLKRQTFSTFHIMQY